MTGGRCSPTAWAAGEDLPIPFSLALTGAAVALLVSFLALALLWREPRLDPAGAGRPLPVARCSGRWTRAVTRVAAARVSACSPRRTSCSRCCSARTTPSTPRRHRLRAVLGRRAAALAAARTGVAAAQPDPHPAPLLSRPWGRDPQAVSRRCRLGSATGPRPCPCCRSSGWSWSPRPNTTLPSCGSLRGLLRGPPAGGDVLRVALVRPRRRVRGVLVTGRPALAARPPR